MRARRQGAAPPLDARGQRRGAAHARAGDRARPQIRPCPCLEGLRARARLGSTAGARTARPRSSEVGEELQIALALDDNDSDVHRILAALQPDLQRSREGACTTRSGRSASIPNNDLIVVQQGELLTWLGRPEEGIEWIRKAMRLNPYHPERFWNHLGRAYYVARRYAEAVEAFAGSAGPITPTTPSWPPPARRWAMRPRRRAHAARGARAASPPSRSRPISATLHYKQRERPRAPSRGAAQGRPAAVSSSLRREALLPGAVNVGESAPARQRSLARVREVIAADE